MGYERRMLSRLNYCISLPTHNSFLTHFIQLSAVNFNSPSIMENLTRLYAELGLMNYEISTKYYPSMLAAAAVYVARATLLFEAASHDLWPHESLEMHTGYTELQVMDCAKMMVAYRLIVNKYATKLRIILDKYKCETRDAVERYPAPAFLLDRPSSTHSQGDQIC
ncbi:G2/mitotic-specific cyclin S13-7-like [Rutidosis leptorrhynchoides]|uniref:G2/mitotic-specific cyclin S13-7-like n=1 Tax=Rutidosis leptorrhynchoides TaxID=125765 RepID=UPI003A99901D